MTIEAQTNQTITVFESMSRLRAEFKRASESLLEAQTFLTECPGDHASAIYQMALDDYIAAYDRLNRDAWRDAGPMVLVADETAVCEYTTPDGVMSMTPAGDDEIPF